MKLLTWVLLLLAISGLSEAARKQNDPPAGQQVLQLLKARFQYADIDYPPERIQLIALKESRKLELWAWQDHQWRHIHDYPVFAASGHTGPKLREGDKQVPEGFYRIESLNPNSNFHLSLKLNYPNPYDWKNASDEGRKTPGSNIFIHGSAWSVGCLAIGNRSVEELYTLVAKIGAHKAHVLIAPYDFRVREVKTDKAQPPWLKQLYTYLNLRMEQFPLTEKKSKCSVDCLLNQEKLTYKIKQHTKE
ncbi:MAG: L,D-transpeptidase family protein [Pseudomonadota bacterium]